MITKAALPLTLFDSSRLSAITHAYFEFAHLKQLYRQGWLKRDVAPERCESVAEHSLGVAMLALWLTETYFPKLDANKVLRMALLHDVGEVYAGDMTPIDGVTAEEKYRLERAAVEQIFRKLPQGATYIALWEEYEVGATPEAQLVRQLDRLEMGFQAAIYEQQGLLNPFEFYASTEKAVNDPFLRELFAEARQHLPAD